MHFNEFSFLRPKARLGFLANYIFGTQGDPMKTLFLNPPFHPMFSRESRSPCVAKSSTLYWPMFLSYAAAYTEADGNEILLLDSPAMELDPEATLIKTLDFGPDLIVVNTSTPSIVNDLGVCRALKQKLPNSKIAIMGTHATAEPVESLDLEAALDYVIHGEADATSRDLVRFLRGEPILEKDISGLAFRDATGKIIKNPDREKIEDLDEIPWVSKTYHKYLHSCYKKYFYGANLNPLIVILSTRGCPYRCTYCVVPQTLTGHVVRRRSAKDVVDELEYIKATFEDLGEVFFEDDTFTADPRHVEAICEEILSRGLKIIWSGNARADVPEDLLKLMKKAGCRELCVGFESASPEVLKNVQKGNKRQTPEEFMKGANEAGILIHGCFMVGNLGDNRETLRSTLDFAKRINPNTAQFYPIMAYPGTKAFEQLKGMNKLATTDYSKWLDKEGHHNTTVLCDTLSSQDLVDFCDQARREFYLRPKYIVRQAGLALFSSRERYRVLRGFGTLVKHLFKHHGNDSLGERNS
jgi:radical SAM superfamily enzyme YgiQ (UPF0313 family)